MRVVCICLLCLMLFSQSVMAVAPVTLSIVFEAQEYGKNKVADKVNDFMQPWMVYEEKVVKLNDTVEKAFIYTPYLLLAIDARNKYLKGEKIRLLDNAEILKNYRDIVVFSVVLFEESDNNEALGTIMLKQGTSSYYPFQKLYQTAVPIENNGKNYNYRHLCYFYFKASEIKLDKPVVLTIAGKEKTRNFYFDLAKIK